MAVPAHLIDSNILVRISRRDDSDHAVVDAALGALAHAGSPLCYTHQNIAEFWNVATRPVNQNGFGLSISDTRLVAAMKVHGITHLLTLNTSDFARYPGVLAVHPGALMESLKHQDDMS